jgi:hypothetical protein
MCGTRISMRRQENCGFRTVFAKDFLDRLVDELTLTARFKHASSAARGTRTAPLALWAGHFGRGFSKTSFRMDFPFTVAHLAVAISSGVTIRAALRAHTARPTGCCCSR